MKKTMIGVSLPAALLFVLAGGLGAEPKSVTIKGYVLDSACAYTKNLTKPISSDCAIACAKTGSPLVLLQDDGTIFLPVSDSMPAVGQNQRLMPYAGKRVVATGKVFERGGSKAVVIEKIDNAPSGQ